MDNRFFSLVIVPDNGSEVKHSKFTGELILYGFGSLAVLFLVCIFFIVGFHIKLHQEQNFREAVRTMNQLTDYVEHAQNTVNTLTERLSVIQRNDIAYRKHAYMELPDQDMYRAGIGGHALVDEALVEGLNSPLKRSVSEILLDTTSLMSKVHVQENSLGEINEKILQNRHELNCTPSILPTHSVRISDDYEYRIHPIKGYRHFHAAVDIVGNYGQRIYATADGVVIQAKSDRSLGNFVKIQHEYGYETLYGHMTKILVSAGQQVKKGEIIGTMGQTGSATGVHLHYAISHFGKSVDPKKYF